MHGKLTIVIYLILCLFLVFVYLEGKCYSTTTADLHNNNNISYLYIFIYNFQSYGHKARSDRPLQVYACKKIKQYKSFTQENIHDKWKSYIAWGWEKYPKKKFVIYFLIIDLTKYKKQLLELPQT